MSQPVNLRFANPFDIPAMIDLERQCPTAHWSEEQYRRLFDSGEGSSPRRLALVVEATEVPARSVSKTESGLLGFLVARHLPPEWELENIVVAPAARRKGLATHLFEEFLARARAAKNEEAKNNDGTTSDSVFLEVRESNQAARALYKNWGFKETGRRKGYYASDAEDAILYRRSLL